MHAGDQLALGIEIFDPEVAEAGIGHPCPKLVLGVGVPVFGLEQHPETESSRDGRPPGSDEVPR